MGRKQWAPGARGMGKGRKEQRAGRWCDSMGQRAGQKAMERVGGWHCKDVGTGSQGHSLFSSLYHSYFLKCRAPGTRFCNLLTPCLTSGLETSGLDSTYL